MYNKEILKPNYFLNNDDPECTHDFNTALTKIVASKVNDKTENKRLKQALISKKKMKKIEKVCNILILVGYLHKRVYQFQGQQLY